MADSKISALSSLTGSSVDRAVDVLPIVDTGSTELKKITVVELGKALFTISAEQATTSGTSIDFTSIPAGVKRVNVMFNGVSTNGISNYLIQLGDSGGIENTGYVCSALSFGGEASSTAGFIFPFASASGAHYGQLTLSLQDSSDFTWIGAGSFTNGTNGVFVAGKKSTSAELTQIRITTVGGTDTFDAGSISISYE